MSPPDDRARVSVLVAVDPPTAFRVFTEEIDRWWRRGLKFRVSGKRHGVMHLEPHVGGRLFESIATARGEKVVESGRVTVWDPPGHLAFEWRPTNFAAHESTLVDVTFDPSPSGTLVTVTHSGWSRIRLDHPARHREDVPTFLRNLGLWWGDLMSSLRELAASMDD